MKKTRPSHHYLQYMAATIIILLSYTCSAQYKDDARHGDLIIHTDGGRYLEPPQPEKPYKTEASEHVLFKMHVLAVVDPLQPYRFEGRKIQIGTHAAFDSIEIGYHCCSMYDKDRCRENGIEAILQDGNAKVIFLKKTGIPDQYLYLNSFAADTDRWELNALVHLAMIKRMSRMDTISNDRERYNQFINYYLDEYAGVQTFKTDMLNDLLPGSAFVQYYRKKGVIAPGSYSVVLSGNQKAALYKRLMESLSDDSPPGVKDMLHRFNLLLPEYTKEKLSFFESRLDTGLLRTKIAAGDYGWQEDVLPVMQIVADETGCADDGRIKSIMETISVKIDELNETHEFDDRLDMLIADGVLPLVPEFLKIVDDQRKSNAARQRRLKQ